MKKDLFGLSAEISGIAMMVTGLSNQLDNNKTDTLTVSAMEDALFGISSYLIRISDDLIEFEEEKWRERSNDNNE